MGKHKILKAKKKKKDKKVKVTKKPICAEDSEHYSKTFKTPFGSAHVFWW